MRDSNDSRIHLSMTSEIYRLLDGSQFHRSEVLNHRVGQEGRLRRGDVMEGYLLAQRLQGVPAKFTDRTVMSPCLAISNQFDEIKESTFAITVQRVPAPYRLRGTRHSNLFERKDGRSVSTAVAENPAGSRGLPDG